MPNLDNWLKNNPDVFSESDEDYNYEPAEYNYLELVCLKKEYDRIFNERLEIASNKEQREVDDAESYQIVGRQIKRFVTKTGQLKEHPYWLHKLQSIDGKTEFWAEENEIMYSTTNDPKDIEQWF